MCNFQHSVFSVQSAVLSVQLTKLCVMCSVCSVLNAVGSLRYALLVIILQCSALVSVFSLQLAVVFG